MLFYRTFKIYNIRKKAMKHNFSNKQEFDKLCKSKLDEKMLTLW